MEKANFAPIAVVVERSQNELLMRSLEDGILRRFKEDLDRLLFTLPLFTLFSRKKRWVRRGTVRYGEVRSCTVNYGQVRSGTVRYGDTNGLNSLEKLYVRSHEI